MAITPLFDRGNKCSIHFTPTVKLYKLALLSDCESDIGVRIPASPISFCRLTDKPIRYERIIRGSNPLKKTLPN